MKGVLTELSHLVLPVHKMVDEWLIHIIHRTIIIIILL